MKRSTLIGFSKELTPDRIKKFKQHPKEKGIVRRYQPTSVVINANVLMTFTFMMDITVIAEANTCNPIAKHSSTLATESVESTTLHQGTFSWR